MNREKFRGSKITVVIADSDPIVRSMLTQVLMEEPDFAVLATEPDCERAVSSVTALKPDLLLADVLLPRISWLHVAVSYRSVATRPVLMCATFERRRVLNALYRGSLGVWMKDRMDLLAECLRSVSSGSCWNRTHEAHDLGAMIYEIESDALNREVRLTSREQEVVLLSSSGLTDRDIGEHLQIKEKTVKRHLTHMYDKLGISNRADLARFALEHGLISRAHGGKQ